MLEESGRLDRQDLLPPVSQFVCSLAFRGGVFWGDVSSSSAWAIGRISFVEVLDGGLLGVMARDMGEVEERELVWLADILLLGSVCV